MNRLTLTEEQHDLIVSVIAARPSVESAVVLLGHCHDTDAGTRYLLRDVQVPPDSAYAERNEHRAVLHSAYVGPAVRQARGAGAFVGFLHNHPGVERPAFSRLDDQGEATLEPFLGRQFESGRHLSVVAGTREWTAREFGKRVSNPSDVEVVVVGKDVRRITRADASPAAPGRYERQLRAFGPEGQQSLERLRVGIIGLGGTGSLVAQQLAHLGVGHMTLVDFDLVDESNLNRLVGAGAVDVGRPKIEVIGASIAHLNQKCRLHLTPVST